MVTKLPKQLLRKYHTLL